MSEKYQYFNGLKFTRDEKSGYYLNSTIGKRMHRYVWEFYHGKIPKGYHIHHIDGDKSNNRIENLRMIQGRKHQSRHTTEYHKEHPEAAGRNMEKARSEAKRWHSSREGKEWHKKQMKAHPIIEKQFVCQCCGMEYMSRPNGKNRFCSNKCRQKYHRMKKRAK